MLFCCTQQVHWGSFFDKLLRKKQKEKLGFCESFLCLNHSVLFLCFTQYNSSTFQLFSSLSLSHCPFSGCSYHFGVFHSLSSCLSSALTISICPLM